MEKRTDSAIRSAFQVSYLQYQSLNLLVCDFRRSALHPAGLCVQCGLEIIIRKYICQLVAFGSVAGRHSFVVIASLSLFMLHCINGENALAIHARHTSASRFIRPPPCCHHHYNKSSSLCHPLCDATSKLIYPVRAGGHTIKINETVIRAP